MVDSLFDIHGASFCDEYATEEARVHSVITRVDVTAVGTI
jgi:hypothetical protein